MYNASMDGQPSLPGTRYNKQSVKFGEEFISKSIFPCLVYTPQFFSTFCDVCNIFMNDSEPGPVTFSQSTYFLIFSLCF